jgi:hypothetical protein
MSDVPLYHRTELPPERAGLAKPPYELADTSGQQQFGQTVAHFSGKLFSDVVTRRANREHAEFVGFAKAEMERVRTYVAANPGLAFEEYENQINQAMENIAVASEQATTGIGADANAQWAATNLPVAQQRMLTDATEELYEHERKRAEETFGKALIDIAIITDPEGNPVLDKQGNPTYDWNNAKKIVTNPAYLQAMGVSLKDAASMLSNVKAQVAAQEMRRTVKSDKSVQSQFAEMAMDIDVSDLSLSEYREMLDKAHFGETIEGKTVYTFKGRASNMPFIDDTDYEELSDAVLKGLDDVLRGAHTRARDMIVAHPDDNAMADYLDTRTKGMKPSAADLFRKTANEERQYQFAMVQKYDREMKLWYAENKEKSGKEIYSHLESKKWEYFNVAKEGIERMKKEVAAPIEIEKEKTGVVRVMSPDGRTGTIPASQLEEALEAGYTEIE